MNPNLRFEALIVRALAETELMFIRGVSVRGVSRYCEPLRSTFLAPNLLVGGLDEEVVEVMAVDIVGLGRLEALMSSSDVLSRFVGLVACGARESPSLFAALRDLNGVRL